MNVRILTLALVLTSLACRSAQTFHCDGTIAARPPRNFGQVLTTDGKPTQIFRGGQPEDCAELEYLQSLGIRNILKLNDRRLPQDVGELTQAARLGFGVVNLPFDAGSIGLPETCPQVRAAVDALVDSAGPVYVHCTAGKDRTGYIIGLYEKLVLHKPTGAVLEELRRFGHRGARSALMPQIDRELGKDAPDCGIE